MSGWKVLAEGSVGVGISRCPGGYIHLNYRNVTLRFNEEDFRAFVAVVKRAAANLGGPESPQWMTEAGLDEVKLQHWLAAISAHEHSIVFSNN